MAGKCPKRWMISAVLLAVAATKTPVERVVTGDGIARVTINGVEGRMRIDPAAMGIPVVTADWAARAGLKRSMVHLGYGIGPVRISGHTAVARIDLGNGATKRRIGFVGSPYAAGVNGVIGPGGLVDPVIRFVLRPSIPGEQSVSFAMIGQGGFGSAWAERFAVIEVGGRPIWLRFDPHHARTLATAGAGVRLAQHYGGTLSGGATPVEIAFGVERPVRDLTLARPLMLGPLAIVRLGVRTSDNGTVAAIADTDAAPVAADPDEIVVVAKGKTRDPSRDRLALGADVLGRCSSIVFDKPARVVRLTCA